MRGMRQIDKYLALAEQADEAAKTALSPVARNTWLMIAARYRKLSQLLLQASAKPSRSANGASFAPCIGQSWLGRDT